MLCRPAVAGTLNEVPMKLSVNLNKVALLRNSRGARRPAPLTAARVCLDAGAAGLTLHWREDNRHTLREDVVALRALAEERGREFNLEGDLRDELIALALDLVPDQVTLVPVTPGEVTSDHGWRFPDELTQLTPVVSRLRAAGIRVSLFVDPIEGAAQGAAQTGADRIEIYTEPYAAAFGTDAEEATRDAIARTASEARRAGLGVNAGHDLDLHNLPSLARAVRIDEVSIGHALISDALSIGLEATVRRYVLATRGIHTPIRPPTL